MLCLIPDHRYIYQQIVGIPIGTNCAPSVADFLLYSYEADFVQHLQKSKFKKQKSLNNPKFNYYIDVIYPLKFEIKDTADAPKWANYLDLNEKLYYNTS